MLGPAGFGDVWFGVHSTYLRGLASHGWVRCGYAWFGHVWFGRPHWTDGGSIPPVDTKVTIGQVVRGPVLQC